MWYIEAKEVRGVTQEKPVIYLGSSQKDLKKLPKAVKDEFLHGFQEACRGRSHPNAKPLKGYKGRECWNWLVIIEATRFEEFTLLG